MHHSVILCEIRMDIVKKVVAEALPDVVPEPIINLIQTLGVESEDDLQYVEDRDLLPCLKPIQARKLLNYIKTRSKLSVCSYYDTEVLTFERGHVTQTTPLQFFYS